MVDCVFGALDEYDSRSTAEQERNFPRPQFRRIAVRYCREAERRGFMDDDSISDAKAVAIMNDVVDRMRAGGEPPR